MRKLKKLLKRLKFQYRPAEKKTKLILLGVIGLMLAAVLILSLTTDAFIRSGEAARQQAIDEENRQNELQSDLENKDSVDGVIDYAEDELGMVPTDATVVVPVE